MGSTNSDGGAPDAANSGKVIPGSVRADGSRRKEIRVRAGYTAPEEVEVYKNRTAEDWKRRGEGPAPGAQFVEGATGTSASGAGAAANKNAKRREARKKAAAVASATATGGAGGLEGDMQTDQVDAEVKAADLETNGTMESADAKEARKLAKKLRQARELKDKKEQGGALLPEQLAKVIKIQELIRQLDVLGFDTEGEKKGDAAAVGRETPDATIANTTGEDKDGSVTG